MPGKRSAGRDAPARVGSEPPTQGMLGNYARHLILHGKGAADPGPVNRAAVALARELAPLQHVLLTVFTDEDLEFATYYMGNPKVSVREAVEWFNSNTELRAESNAPVRSLAGAVPNDPLFARQWAWPRMAAPDA